jgi:large subunit ribosomal protein L4
MIDFFSAEHFVVCDIHLPYTFLSSIARLPFNSGLAHEVAMAELSNLRQGTRAQKTRAQVCFSGKKLWRQKGTGRARVGTRASPSRIGGGRAFPSTVQESFKKKINKRLHHFVFLMLIARLCREKRIVVFEGFCEFFGKVKLFKRFLKKINCYSAKNTLFVFRGCNDYLERAGRNLGCRMVDVTMMRCVDLMQAEKVYFSHAAMKEIERAFHFSEGVQYAS